MMNHWNKLLPTEVRGNVLKDEIQSRENIEKSMFQLRLVLNTEGAVINSKDLGKLFRYIAIYGSLKYTYQVLNILIRYFRC
jgi:hypothetical protein